MKFKIPSLVSSFDFLYFKKIFSQCCLMFIFLLKFQSQCTFCIQLLIYESS